MNAASLLSLHFNARRHEEGLAHASALHSTEMEHDACLHHMSVQADLQRLKEEMELERRLRTREVKLDEAFDHRDQLRHSYLFLSEVVQAILLGDTLMLGCGFSFVWSIPVPPDASGSVHTAYMFFLWLSFALLFSSTAMSFALQARIQHYDIHAPPAVVYWCGHTHDTFQSYYACRGSSIEKASLTILYLGTASFLVASAIFVSMQMLPQGHNLVSAVVGFCIPVGMATVWLLVGDCFVPTDVAGRGRSRGGGSASGREREPTANDHY